MPKDHLIKSTNSDLFDVDVLCSSLTSYLDQSKDQLQLKYYIVAYREVYKFFVHLGSVFAFVAKDVHAKLQILTRYLEEDANYGPDCTLKSMIEYERKEDLLKDTRRPSGTRTFLRLHRAMQFVQQFSLKLSTAEGHERTDLLAKDAYQNTLAVHHSWLIQKGVSFALHLLPNVHELCKRVLGSQMFDLLGAEMVKQKLHDMSELTLQTFDECEAVMIREKVTDLP